MNTDLTIIILCHATATNKESEWVLEAMESVKGQYPIVLVDNGEQENLIKLRAAKYEAKYIRAPVNCLPPVARNLGVKACDTPYFLVLDADDHLLPFSLNTLAFLNQPNVAVVYGDMIGFGETSYPIPCKNHNIKPGDFDRDNQIFHASIIRKEAWESVGGYWEDCWSFEDWDLFARISAYDGRDWRFVYCDQPFTEHRVRSDSRFAAQCKSGEFLEGRKAVINHVHKFRQAGNKYEQPECTVVMTYRQRKFEPNHERLKLFMEHFALVKGVSDLIIVHQGPGVLMWVGANIINTKYDGVFSRAWGLNVGARAAKTEVVSFVDVDDILPPDYLLKDLDDLENEFCFVVHGAQVPWGTPEENKAVENLAMPFAQKISKARMFQAANGYGPEGHITIRLRDFAAVRGYNEQMFGWGHEDNDLVSRLVASGIPKRQVLDRMRTPLHVDHPREFDDKYPNGEQRNKAIAGGW